MKFCSFQQKKNVTNNNFSATGGYPIVGGQWGVNIEYNVI